MEFSDYAALAAQLDALSAETDDPVSIMANASAFLMEALPGLNWVGFYSLRGDRLILGPFQGRVACVELPLGRGVCSAAVTERRALSVADVADFPGHIACDCRSRSELVVPLFGPDGGVRAVLDLDSAACARFSEADEEGLTALGALLSRKLFSSL